MQEQEIITEIRLISSNSTDSKTALLQLQQLLAREYGGALLAVRPARPQLPISTPREISSREINDFLESKAFPVRSLFTAPLTGRKPATLFACIGSWGAPTETLRRITNCIAANMSEAA